MSAQVSQQSRYTLTLSDQERESLLGLVQQALADARVAAHRTHTPDYRALIIGQAVLLRELVEKLGRLGPDRPAAPTEIPVAIAGEAPVIDELYIDEEGRFQMAAAELDDFIPFLRDHEVRVDVEAAEAFRAGGAAYGYGRLAHSYDADSVAALYKTWRQAHLNPAGAMA